MDPHLPVRAAAKRPIAAAALAATAALLLAGCGSSARDRAIEQRLAAAEAKAEAAEKRAREAELAVGAAAATPAPTDSANAPELLEDEGQDAAPTDPDAEASRFDNEIVAPQPPAPAPDSEGNV